MFHVSSLEVTMLKYCFAETYMSEGDFDISLQNRTLIVQ